MWIEVSHRSDHSVDVKCHQPPSSPFATLTRAHSPAQSLPRRRGFHSINATSSRADKSPLIHIKHNLRLPFQRFARRFFRINQVLPLELVVAPMTLRSA
jgi:hypothetical protein